MSFKSSHETCDKLYGIILIILFQNFWDVGLITCGMNMDSDETVVTHIFA